MQFPTDPLSDEELAISTNEYLNTLKIIFNDIVERVMNKRITGLHADKLLALSDELHERLSSMIDR
jgi:hypothetical protein